MKSTAIQSNPLWSLEQELYIADGEPYVFNDTLHLYGSRDVPDGMIDVSWKFGQMKMTGNDWRALA